MNFDNYFPVWNELNTAQKKLISDNLITQHVKKGTVIHNDYTLPSVRHGYLSFIRLMYHTLHSI